MNDSSVFGGRIAVVTGGAGGIGAACCRQLAEDGARVVIVDRNIDAAQVMAAEISAVTYTCDIADEAKVAELAARVEKEVGDVFALVNCAGIVQGRQQPYEMSMRKWDDIVRVNQRGTYIMCLAFARSMLERGQGAIVNIASVAGIRSMPLHAYGPAKAAVIAMTQTLAAEWGSKGLRINAVSPGFTLTEGMANALESGMMEEARLRSAASLGRLVYPIEVATAVSFLISDRASAITGINLPVDCGWLAGSTWDVYGGLSHSS